MQAIIARLLVIAALAIFCVPARAADCSGSTGYPCGPLEYDAIYRSDLSLGVPANSSWPGSVAIANGGASGVFVTILNPSATAAYNFNLPATAGASTYLLTSAGGATSAMTWTSPTTTINGTACTLGSTCSPTAVASSVVVGTTGVTGGTTGYILYNNASVLGNVQYVPLSAGGTNAGLTASAGGIFYSTSSAGAILSGTATANQMLQSGSSAAPAWSTATWPATTTINRIIYSSAANTVGEITTGNSGVLVTSSGGVPSISTSIPSGVTAATNSNAADATTQVATNAFVQNALLLSMATVPMTITSGTYSFATASTNFPIINCTAGGGAISSCAIFSGGSGFAVGDIITPAGGNHDALLRVATLSGSAVASLIVVYGGTGYTTQSGITTAASTAIPYTFLLSGTLTGSVTIIATSGTYLTASQQWYFANNTTGAYTVTVCVSNGSDACSAGRTAVIPQGTNNSRIVGVQTDGVLNADIASIVNAADLTGSTLASGVTGSSLTSLGTIGTGVWQGTAVGPAYGGTGHANNAANTITFSGNYGLTLTLSNTTSLTLPTSGTLATTAVGTVFGATATGGGSANAQTFATGNPSTWTLTAGNSACGVLGFTNTGAATMAVNGTTATAVNRRSTSGLTALVGGEMLAGQVACFNYDGTVFELNTAVPGAVEIKSGSYAVSTQDGWGDTYDFTAASPTLTLLQSTTVPNNWHITVFANGGPITVTPYASDTINGGSAGVSVTIPQGNFGTITTDGAGHDYVSGLSTPLTALATQATNTVVGNATAGTAAPTALSMTSCSTANSGVIWTTSTGFGCNSNLAGLTTADQTLSGGANLTTYSLGTKSSGTLTVDCGLNPAQNVLNGGAFTLAAPANDGNCLVQVVQGASAGAITLSGFSTSPSGTGDALATANTVSGSCTVTSASPAVITYTQTFVVGQAVYLTAVAMPTGTTSGQIYYVISAGLSGSQFEISATPGGAAVNTSSTGTTVVCHEPAVFTANVFRVNGLANLVWKQQQ